MAPLGSIAVLAQVQGEQDQTGSSPEPSVGSAMSLGASKLM